MADSTERDQDETLETGAEPIEGGAAGTEAAEPVKLNLDVQIDSRSACERHITVKVAREDIDRYFDKEFSELMPNAQVPGFRPGRAPRKLVENRFRKDLAQKIKTELLMDSLSQLNEDHKLSAISEPDIDLDAVELPDEGPLSFEFNLEVRPEFDLPTWKGLKLEKPVRTVDDKEVDAALATILENRGRLAPHEGPAEAGDYITCNVTFKQGDEVLSTHDELMLRLLPTLSLQDGKVENFGGQMAGIQGGETRTLEAHIADDAQEERRGQVVTAEFAVLDVKRLEKAELTPELLEELGDFSLEADLRDAIRDSISRRLGYEQQRRARQQISKLLTEAASWELPPGLLQRQSRRELQRAVMELQRSGFSEEQIRAHENELRQNSRASTAQALKEHFILERIAEDQNIEADDNDYDIEMSLLAAQSRESVRRVRARLEKSGSMDVLRNQIIERKVIELIMEHAQFQEVPFEVEANDVEAVEAAICRQESEIPEAKAGGEASPTGRPEEPRPHG
jgi:trigger factor